MRDLPATQQTAPQYSDEPGSHHVMFRYPRQSQTAAWGLVMAAAGVASIGSLVLALVGANDGLVLSVRLLGLASMMGPLAWLGIQWLHRRAGVILTTDKVILRQPVRFFDRAVPHDQIGVATTLDSLRVALIWLRPRRVAPGDEPRPPQPRLLVSVPIHDVKNCGILLQQYLEQVILPEAYRHWTIADIVRRKRRRALGRRLILFILMPLVCLFGVIVLARIIFALLRF